LLFILKETSSKRKCSKLHLQRLIGKLNWAAHVVWGGHMFLRCLITLANAVKFPYLRVYCNLCARADLLWWTSLLPAHNSKTLFPSATPELPTAVPTDDSLSGGGCIWETDWMYVNWALDYPALCTSIPRKHSQSFWQHIIGHPFGQVIKWSSSRTARWLWLS